MFFSYTLSMIPDWFAALENARRLLKPGGTIGVVTNLTASSSVFTHTGTFSATVTALKKQPAAHPHVIATSSEKLVGIPELRAVIHALP